MAIDLNKLRAAKKQPPVIDPVEIFRRLPKTASIKDLYGSQVEVLQAWFASRTETDHVLKLHTGGGKTLVGLLIAQSILTELGETERQQTNNRPFEDALLAALARSDDDVFRRGLYQKFSER
ncbi:MAG TPA: hypothetical protein VG893_11970 [Terracidiphilus sp.]|nr:hypothetical protein [Terracidiphilus sp.]